MRESTRKIAEAMDKACDLTDQNKLTEAQILLAKIVKMLIEWVDKELCKHVGHNQKLF